MFYSVMRKGVLFSFVCICLAAVYPVSGQSNGGLHSIRGTIFLPNGRVLDRTIKVELQSTNNPTQTDFSDINGAFAFIGVNPGTYTVVVNAGESFEVARENLQIDAQVQSRSFRIPAIPKNLKVPIHLRSKPTELARNEVLNAKWSAIPKDAVQHFKRGLDLLQQGKDGDAEAEFRRSVAAAPTFSPAHTALGSLELKAGKLEPAVESFKKAIRYDATDFHANLNLGIAFVNLHRYDDAEPVLVTAAYINRTAVIPHYYLGIIFFVKHDLDVARKAFETAKSLKDPKSMPQLHRYLGQIYEAKKMNKEAVLEFETYLSIAPAAKDADGVRKAINEIKGRNASN